MSSNISNFKLIPCHSNTNPSPSGYVHSPSTLKQFSPRRRKALRDKIEVMTNSSGSGSRDYTEFNHTCFPLHYKYSKSGY